MIEAATPSLATLNLLQESLAMFEAVILTQLLGKARKTLFQFIEVPVDNARRRRRPRIAKRKVKDRQRNREKKSLKEASSIPKRSLPLPCYRYLARH